MRTGSANRARWNPEFGSRSWTSLTSAVGTANLTIPSEKSIKSALNERKNVSPFFLVSCFEPPNSLNQLCVSWVGVRKGSDLVMINDNVVNQIQMFFQFCALCSFPCHCFTRVQIWQLAVCPQTNIVKGQRELSQKKSVSLLSLSFFWTTSMICFSSSVALCPSFSSRYKANESTRRLWFRYPTYSAPMKLFIFSNSASKTGARVCTSIVAPSELPPTSSQVKNAKKTPKNTTPLISFKNWSFLHSSSSSSFFQSFSCSCVPGCHGLKKASAERNVGRA